MKTKVVYVLVSSDKDIYLEQMYVSMYSLRFYNPNAYVVLLTDSQTAMTFTGRRKEMTKYADEIVKIELDSSLNGQQKSRQLKTSIRNRIDGDFLFIDCDTIITRDISCIDETSVSIAACRDTHSSFIDNPYRDMCLKDGQLLGWPIEGEKDYFNSGVIYVKDNSETREFYRRWNENLNLGYSKKVYMDQPSFAKTNYEMGHIVRHLDDIWNCELKHGIRYLKDAFIIHYLCTNVSTSHDKQLFILNEEDVLLEVKRTGDISEQIKETIVDPFKGIAEITHCFAGEDVYFFKTFCYNFVRQHYRTRRQKMLVITLRILRKFERMIRKVTII